MGFAVRAMDLCDSLEKMQAGTLVAGQLLRCATSAAPNYAEARGTESGRDFVHKLGIVLKELNEAEVWLDILIQRRMLEGEEVLRVQEECKTLCRIIGASVRTAGRNLSRLNNA